MSTGGVSGLPGIPCYVFEHSIVGYTAGQAVAQTPEYISTCYSQAGCLEALLATPGHRNVTMAKNKGSGAKTLKEDKTGGNAKGKGKGKGKTGGKDEKDTESGTKKGFNEINVRHILW